MPQIRDILFGSKKNGSQNFEQVTRVAYLHVILFRMPEKDTDTEKKIDIVLQITTRTY